jgi:hypothetical protein
MRAKLKTPGKRKANENEGYERVSGEKSIKRKLLESRRPKKTDKDIDPLCKNQGKPSDNAAGEDIERSSKGRVESSNAAGRVSGSGRVEDSSNAAGRVSGSGGRVEGSKGSGRLHNLKRLGGKKEIRQNEFLKVFGGNLFNISDAARQIGINRSTVYHWKADPDFRQRFEDCIEERKDWLENKLFEKIESGDVACTIFACKCLLKDRGYLPDKLLTVNVDHKDNRLNMTKEQRDSFIESAMVTPETLSDSPVKRQLQEIYKKKYSIMILCLSFSLSKGT